MGLIRNPEYFSEEPKLVTTTSDGCVQLHSLSQGHLQTVSTWKAHDYEAWICAFNYWDTNMIFTGKLTSKTMNSKSTLFMEGKYNHNYEYHHRYL